MVLNLAFPAKKNASMARKAKREMENDGRDGEWGTSSYQDHVLRVARRDRSSERRVWENKINR